MALESFIDDYRKVNWRFFFFPWLWTRDTGICFMAVVI